MRILQNPKFLGIVGVVILIFTALNVYREINFSDYSINPQATSLVFNLKNNRYFEVTPVNDHMISIFGSRNIQPFAAADANNINVSGLDLGPLSKTYAYNSQSDAGTRMITIYRTSPTASMLDFKLNINFAANAYRYYRVQLDYSGVPEQAYFISHGIRLVDRGCTVDITDDQTATYETYNDDRTVLVDIPYSPVMQFKISMQIICNQ